MESRTTINLTSFMKPYGNLYKPSCFCMITLDNVQRIKLLKCYTNLAEKCLTIHSVVLISNQVITAYSLI